MLFPLLSVGWAKCSIEILQLLMACYKYHPNACGKNFLRVNKWVNSKSDKPELISKFYAFMYQCVVVDTGKSTPSVFVSSRNLNFLKLSFIKKDFLPTFTI